MELINLKSPKNHKDRSINKERDKIKYSVKESKNNWRSMEKYELSKIPEIKEKRKKSKKAKILYDQETGKRIKHPYEVGRTA